MAVWACLEPVAERLEPAVERRECRVEAHPVWADPAWADLACGAWGTSEGEL